MNSYTDRSEAVKEARESLEAEKALGIEWAKARKEYAMQRNVAIATLEANGYSKNQAYDRSKYVDNVIVAEYAMNCAEVLLNAEKDRHMLAKLESRHYEDDLKREWSAEGGY